MVAAVTGPVGLGRGTPACPGLGLFGPCAAGAAMEIRWVPARRGAAGPRRDRGILGPVDASSERMSILDSLLGRWGYVRLDGYGLVRTSEGRILMTHRRVLDDGMGGRIVGWRAEDPAPTVLESMDLVPRAAVKQVEAARSSIAMASHVVPAAVAAAAMAKKPAPKPAATVVEDDDDEWEWQMALARARAAAEETEDAKAAIVDRSKALPTLVAVQSTKSAIPGPVLAVAKLTPASPPPVPTKQAVGTKPVPKVLPAKVAPIRQEPIAPPISLEKARIARGSASPASAVGISPRVMSPPRAPAPPARVTKTAQRPAPSANANERPLPLPAPEETVRTKAAPPAAPPPLKPVVERADSEITQTDLRPALPRFSARFR